MMDKIAFWTMEDDLALGRQYLEGSPKMSSLAVPMMMLCIISQIETMDSSLEEKYKKATDWAVKEILMHIQV